jgi:peptidyl-dipeptidase A
MRQLVLLAAIAVLAACSKPIETPPPEATPPPPAGPTAADADKFVAGINEDLRKILPYQNSASWVQETFITDDTQAIGAKATAEYLAYQAKKLQEAKQFNSTQGISADSARALMLIKNTSSPPPSDAGKQAELAQLLSKMDANYGAGKWCPGKPIDGKDCLNLTDIEKIVDNVGMTRSPDEILAAWDGWHASAKPIRKDYQRFVELVNDGAKEMGYADTGEVWRAGYDMSPADFSKEVDRLWDQVKPLYQEMHCYVRTKLNAKYGDKLVPRNGEIPAHLLGNMWAQQWGNVYPLVEPYKGVGSIDVSPTLKKQRDEEYQKLLKDFKGAKTPEALTELGHKADAAESVRMARIAEDFYTSIGFPKLPDSFWQKSMLTRPRDRDVVCHASAWDMNMAGDVRVKMCIEPKEEDLTTIHHELGHIFYDLSYNPLPPIFQNAAHDGFHEAIGDTITLSLTPAHLHKIGLVGDQKPDPKATINSQMKWALDKIVFLPWAKLVDQWRWQVFSGQVKPENYNAAWWNLREQYQGVAPPNARNEEAFDPGAKYHVAGNTPYTRYFLSFILQFQFQKALCDAAGFKGPLNECDIYGNTAAGEKYKAMLAAGASKPWQETLEKLTGTRQMDASAILEYFAPLIEYLKQQNQGQQCGWEPAMESPPPAETAPATEPPKT